MQTQFETRNLYFTSLGCSKNLVDAQVMLGYLGLDGFSVVDSPELAEAIIVNTCSFVEAAKKVSPSAVECQIISNGRFAWPVIRHHQDQRVLVFPELLKASDQSPHVLINSINHPCIDRHISHGYLPC